MAGVVGWWGGGVVGWWGGGGLVEGLVMAGEDQGLMLLWCCCRVCTQRSPAYADVRTHHTQARAAQRDDT